MHKPKHYFEAFLFHLVYAAFRVLPLDAASYIGGLKARCLGPFHRSYRIAENNLKMAMPELTAPERGKILTGMCDHLGRVAAELFHLPGDTLANRVTVRQPENLPKPGEAVLFFSGHFGNWELLSSITYRRGLPVTLIYRTSNNALVDRIVAKLRASQATDMLPKGPRGGFKMARALKAGESLAMLIDQKMNEGIPVPFFGRDAMTAPAIAQLALRYGMPIVPTCVRRLRGAHFEATIYPALVFEKTGDEEKDALAIMTEINRILESWIRECPEQWFWVHKRWPS